jgi:hypothetical protein
MLSPTVSGRTDFTLNTQVFPGSLQKRAEKMGLPCANEQCPEQSVSDLLRDFVQLHIHGRIEA